MAKITVSLNQIYEYKDFCQVIISTDNLVICTFFLDKEQYQKLRREADQWFNLEGASVKPRAGRS